MDQYPLYMKTKHEVAKTLCDLHEQIKTETHKKLYLKQIH